MAEVIVLDTILRDERFKLLVFKEKTVPNALGIWLKALFFFSNHGRAAAPLVHWAFEGMPQSLIDVGLFVVKGSEVLIVPPLHARDQTFSLAETRGLTVDALKDLWNEHSGNLPKVKELGLSRRRHALIRLKECGDAKAWEAVIKFISTSPFHIGFNDRKWKADFDYLIRPNTRIKIAEKIEVNGNDSHIFEGW